MLESVAAPDWSNHIEMWRSFFESVVWPNKWYLQTMPHGIDKPRSYHPPICKEISCVRLPRKGVPHRIQVALQRSSHRGRPSDLRFTVTVKLLRETACHIWWSFQCMRLNLHLNELTDSEVQLAHPYRPLASIHCWGGPHVSLSGGFTPHLGPDDTEKHTHCSRDWIRKILRGTLQPWNMFGFAPLSVVPPSKARGDGPSTEGSEVEIPFETNPNWDLPPQKKRTHLHGHGSKPMVPFWDRCTTHFAVYFSGWIGMFTTGL